MRMFAIAGASIVTGVHASAQNVSTASDAGGLKTPSEIGLVPGTAAVTATSADPGTPCFETLRSQNTFGYTLTHPNVVAGSLTVLAGGLPLEPGKDYLLNAPAGTIYVTKHLPAGEALEVNYRYLPVGAPGAAASVVPGIKLNLGSSGSLGLTLNMTTPTGTGYNTTLNGLGFSDAFGPGKASQFQGLMYFSNVQANNNLVMNRSFAAPGTPAAPAIATGNDHLIMQNLTLGTRGFTVNANYQDVGQKFKGFAALKNNATGNAALQSQLSELQNEKGIKRMGFGVDIGGNTAQHQAGLSLGFNTISDAKGSIQTQNASFVGGALSLNYGSRTIGQTFSTFNGLREADHVDMSHQQGMRSQAISAALAFGSGKNAQLAGGVQLDQSMYSDSNGSLDRSALSLNHGPLSVSILNSSSSAGFSRLVDIDTSDKQSLALDTYRLYDPSAQMNMVTPVDLGQVPANQGLVRNGTNVGFVLGKQGSLSFSDMTTGELIGNGTSGKQTHEAGFSRQSVGLDLSHFTLNILNRSTNSTFGRFASMPDIDKRFLALDIMREFNPQAQLAQVAPVWAMQAAASEPGLNRNLIQSSFNFGKPGKLTSLMVSGLQITDKKLADGAGIHPEIQRQDLQFSNSQLQLGVTRQTISDAFTSLPSLSDIEKAQFGNQHGLGDQRVSFAWQVNKTVHISVNDYTVSPTPTAAKQLVDSGLAAHMSLSDATAAALAGVHQQNVVLTMPGISITHNVNNVSSDFVRAGDLAMAPPQQQMVAALRGFNESDTALQFTRIKGLNLQTYNYHAFDASQQLVHDMFHQNISFNPSKTMALSVIGDGDVNGTVGKTNGYTHHAFSLTDHLNPMSTFALTQDKRVDLANGQPTSYLQQNLHFDTAHKLAGASLDVQVQAASSIDGKYQNQTNMNVQAHPDARITVGYQQLDMRGNMIAATLPGTNTPVDATEMTRGYNLQYKATPQFVVEFGASDTTTNNNQNGQGMSVGLTGQPFNNLAVTAQFNETHTQGNHNTHEVANVSIGTTKPVNVGPLKDLSFKYGYASLNDMRKLQNENMVGHVNWSMWKNSFLIDYTGVTLPTGQSVTQRTYSFATDPNPKKWFRGSFFYQVHSLITGQQVVSRQFSMDARLHTGLNLVYSYSSQQDDGHGGVLPLTNLNLAVQEQFHKSVVGKFFYNVADNTVTRLKTSGLGISLTGPLTKTSDLSFTYIKALNGNAVGYDRSDQLQLAYSNHIDAEHSLSLNLGWVTHTGLPNTGPFVADELQFGLQFTQIF